jgi:hypothetical protein
MTKKRSVLVTTTLAAAALALPALADEPAPRRWSFDTDKMDGAPSGFSFGRTGSGAQGRWVVFADKSAPSGGQVLAQLDTDDTDYRFPIAVADETAPADLALSVKCKPVSGKVDQACGLVLRYRDENNYYLTRANALENNIRFYFVKDGKRKQVASWSGKVTAGAWHDYRIVAKGDRFLVSWDGKLVLDVKDATFASGGKVGVWTKADSVTYFDDLTLAQP